MTDQQVIVHSATRDDLPELMRLLHIMHAEGGMFPLDEECALEMFGRALDQRQKQGIIGIIRGDDADIRAFMYLMITRFWYTSQYHLEEIFNFVRPDHRRSNYADAMLRYAIHCADDIGVPLLIGVLTNLRMESKVRLYRRRLGMPAGAFFVHGAKWVNERAPNDDIWRTHTRGGRKRNKRQMANGDMLPLSG